MLSDQFAGTEVWVFDLDNTLYAPEMRLFDQIEARITDYMTAELGIARAEADALRDTYWHRYGTTLSGLVAEHAIAPDPYLGAIHQIELTALAPHPPLVEAIGHLPGRRVVYTNGAKAYAGRVLHALGLDAAFHEVYGVEDAGYRSKPERAAFEAVFAHADIAPERAAMFEDDPRNLAAPHAMGMRTILVGPQAVDERHVDHHATDLATFLADLAPAADVAG